MSPAMSMSMSTLPIFTPTLPSTSISSSKPFFLFRTTSFCFSNVTGSASSFRISYKFPRSIFPVDSQLSEEEDEEDEDLDDEDDIAADEYDVVGEESGEEDEEVGVLEPLSAGRSRKFEEFKWQRVERLRNDVKEFGEEILNVDELASIYEFRIDKFQRLAIEAFLRGSSVVVSAPTSSGKTLIAEAAAVATAARGKRLFYTTPLKALSNQKFREFREAFGDGNVGLITGDSAINKDAQVVIMTTEILRNMLYQSVGVVSSDSGLLHVDVIVLDEVHYLSDIARGTVWEEIVIYCPKEVQLICLSATVANPDELAGWIGQIHGKTELVQSSKRPVPLIWHFSMKTALLPLLDQKGTSINRRLLRTDVQLDSSRNYSNKEQGLRRRSSRKRDHDLTPRSKSDVDTLHYSKVPQVIDTLWQLKRRDMLPTVWFIFSRKGCDAAVQYLENCELLDEHEISEVELALKRLRIQYPDAVRESSVRGLLQGVAAHHAGCLPLWKSFIEELFQRGLVKVVFATETLAAGINMPARTAVISSLSKRGQSGRIQLTSNELLQMAGRAGRRGIDKMGHAVLIQTAYEGAEECCKLLFSGLEPLVSQFTASYGMVLNLLAGAKVIRRTRESDDVKYMQAGRTLEEARKLVEQSFGNYVGSSVMQAAKDELSSIQNEIEMLTAEISDEAVDKKCREVLSQSEYKEIANLQEELRVEKRIRSDMRRRLELERLSCLKPLLKNLDNGQLPFLCLQYSDSKGIQHLLPIVYLGKVDQLNASGIKSVVSDFDDFTIDVGGNNNMGDHRRNDDAVPSYYVGLSSDNSWYLFTEKWIRMVFKAGFPNVALAEGEALPQEIMTTLLDMGDMMWQKLAESEFGGLWRMEGSLETWAWSLNVPVLNSLSEDDEVLEYSQAYHDAVASYKSQRNKVARLKKVILRTEGFRAYKKILDTAKFKEEKIRRLKARSSRLLNRIEQIEPSGWKEFVQVSNVIHEARALDINTHFIFPLGETAAAIRGENELWLAMVLRNKLLLDLKPAQLAAVLGSLVSEGIKVRPWKNNSFIYEPSSNVLRVINLLEELRGPLLQLQDKHGVQIPCCLDSQFSGMVEAWASGLTWREMMMECAMDEGDLARLLRRTIDLLAQVPKLPDIDTILQNNAKNAYEVMDRPPLSELAG